MNSPGYLFAAWGDIERKIRRPPRRARLALFTDFDGTLMRIRPDPAAVRLSPAMARLLAGIAGRGTVVGIASGRSADDLRRRARLANVWQIAAHGFFLRDPKNRAFSLLSPAERTRMSRAARSLRARLRAVPGVWLDWKHATLAVHYRRAAAAGRRAAWSAVRDELRAEPTFCLLRGKRVWEILPNGRVDKWTAIRFALDRDGRRRSARRWLVFYLGDDATDERVFRRMRGISIVVGRTRRTAARYFLRSPAEVRQFLERWNETFQ